MLAARAPAKLNLTLRITGKRADGYHLMESLVVFTEWHDNLLLSPADDLQCTVSGPFAEEAGETEANLVLKAARLLQREYANEVAGRGAHFHLTKQVPVGAGLGGGSSDAAAALKLLNAAWDLRLEMDELHRLGLQLGADVPMFLQPVPLVARGIGEILSPLGMALPTWHAVLVHPRQVLRTPDVYAAYVHEPRHEAPTPNPEDMPTLEHLVRHGRNDLQRPAISLCAPIAEVLMALQTHPSMPLVARMSGSGACCFALHDTQAEAARMREDLRARYPHWWVESTAIRSA
jgi:4-diphosphocytidyl-2-C-methyl-D-erythritol kinase